MLVAVSMPGMGKFAHCPAMHARGLHSVDPLHSLSRTALHSLRLQSPIFVLTGVPAGESSSTQTPLMHATVLHGPLGAQSASLAHGPAPPPPPEEDDEEPAPPDELDEDVPSPSDEQAETKSTELKQPEAIHAIR